MTYLFWMLGNEFITDGVLPGGKIVLLHLVGHL